MSKTLPPEIEEHWARIKRPMGMQINLSPRQIYAIGRVIVQWGALEPMLIFHVSLWRMSPLIPESLRADAPPSHANNKDRISFLRACADYIIKNNETMRKEFHQKLAQIQGCKNKRDWFAHGTYDLQSNQSEETICVNYKKHKLRLATAKVEKLANDISLLTGWIMNFETRLHEDVLRASLEKLISRQVKS